MLKFSRKILSESLAAIKFHSIQRKSINTLTYPQIEEKRYGACKGDH